MGFHGNHALSHSLNEFRTKCFVNWGFQYKYGAHVKLSLGVQGRSNKILG